MDRDGHVELITWTKNAKGQKECSVSAANPTGEELRRLKESPYRETRVDPILTYVGPDDTTQDIYNGEPVHARDMRSDNTVWICPIDGRWNGMWYLVPERMLSPRP